MMKSKVKKTGMVMFAAAMMCTTGFTAYGAESVRVTPKASIVNAESVKTTPSKISESKDLKLIRIDEAGKEIETPMINLTPAIIANTNNKDIIKFIKIENIANVSSVEATKVVPAVEVMPAIEIMQTKTK